MYGKIIISCKLKVLTGLHIGGSGSFSPIGAVDSPVIKDPGKNMPIVPGSSLKGKMRTLLVKSIVKGKLPNIENDPKEVQRLFGSAISKSKSDKNVSAVQYQSRLQFTDAHVCNADKFKEIGLTEVKMENTIQRNNTVANPRQIERVVSGVEFDVKIAYDILNIDEFSEDMKNIAKAMKLLQLDYLGGHGSRGSGRVSFEEITLTPVFCDDEVKKFISDIKESFEEVDKYELLSV